MSPRPFQRQRSLARESAKKGKKKSSGTTASSTADVNEYQVDRIIAKRVDMVRSIEQEESPVLLQALQKELERRVPGVQWASITSSSRSNKSNKFAFPLTKQVRRLLNEHYKKAYDQGLSSMERRPSIDSVMGIIKAIDTVIGLQQEASKKTMLNLTVHSDTDGEDDLPVFIKKPETLSLDKKPPRKDGDGSRFAFGDLQPNSISSRKNNRKPDLPKKKPPPPPLPPAKKITSKDRERNLPFGTLGPTSKSNRNLTTKPATINKPPPPPPPHTTGIKTASSRGSSRPQLPFGSLGRNAVSSARKRSGIMATPAISKNPTAMPSDLMATPSHREQVFFGAFNKVPTSTSHEKFNDLVSLTKKSPFPGATPHNTPVSTTAQKKAFSSYAGSFNKLGMSFSSLNAMNKSTGGGNILPPQASTPFPRSTHGHLFAPTPQMYPTSSTSRPTCSSKRKLEAPFASSTLLGSRLKAVRDSTTPTPAFRNTSSVLLAQSSRPTALDPWSSLDSITFSPIKKTRRTSSGRSIPDVLDAIDEKASSGHSQGSSIHSPIILDGACEENSGSKMSLESPDDIAKDSKPDVSKESATKKTAEKECDESRSDAAATKDVDKGGEVSVASGSPTNYDTREAAEPKLAVFALVPGAPKTTKSVETQARFDNEGFAGLKTNDLLEKDLCVVPMPPVPPKADVSKLGSSAIFWSTGEDFLLRKAVSEVQSCNASWKTVAKAFLGKFTALQCKQRWLSNLYLGSRVQWHPTEDAVLIHEMSKEHPLSWSEIADKLSGRASIEVLEQYMKHLDPDI